MNTETKPSVGVLITGCGIYIHSEEKFVWGDLWECGDAYIVNACLDAHLESAWNYNTRPELDERYIIVALSDQCFERRGVIVVNKENATLSERAQQYLERSASL